MILGFNSNIVRRGLLQGSLQIIYQRGYAFAFLTFETIINFFVKPELTSVHLHFFHCILDKHIQFIALRGPCENNF